MQHLPAGALHHAGFHRAGFGTAVAADDQHLGDAVRATLHRTLRHQQRLAVDALGGQHAHVHARQQQLAGVGEAPAQGHLAGAGVHRHIGEQPLAGGLVVGALHPQAQGQVAAAVEAAGLERLAQAQHLGGGLVEVDVDRVQLLDARHQGGVALPHQRAFGDQRTADTPGDGRRHRGVAQVQPRGLDVGAGRAGRRLGTAQVGGSAVVVLAADRLDPHQRLVAANPRTGFVQRRLGPGQLAFGTRQGSLQRGRVDLEQQVAGLDVGAFLEALLHHDAGHPRPHLGHPHRFDAPGQLGDPGQGLGPYHHGLHLARRHLARRGLARLFTPGEHHARHHQGKDSRTAPPAHASPAPWP